MASPDDNYSSASDSETSLTDSQKQLIGAPISHQPQGTDTRLDALIQSINDIITSLYKFSITIQNPAHRDREARAARIGVSFWNESDLRHVKDKFPKSSSAKLLANIAQANTKRRQLFAYHKRHVEKIRFFQESNMQAGQDADQAQAQEVLHKPPVVVATPTVHTKHTIATKLTSTTVSTVRPIAKAIPISISGRSQRTNIMNDAGSNSKDLLRIPPPPGEASGFTDPFICPYCFLTIGPRNPKEWEY
jgi:hypothetical protein